METKIVNLDVRQLFSEVIEYLQFLKDDQMIDNYQYFLNVEVKCQQIEKEQDAWWLCVKISAEGIQSVEINFQDFFDHAGRVSTFIIQEVGGRSFDEAIVFTNQVSKEDDNSTLRTMWVWDEVNECLKSQRHPVTGKCKGPCFLIRVPQKKSIAETGCGAIKRYLRKYKLVNPNVRIWLRIRMGTKVLYPNIGDRCPYSRFGCLYINTDLDQYVSDEEKYRCDRDKILPRSGMAVKLPQITIGKEIFHLKVRCIAALLPPPEYGCQTIPQVTRAKLLFYGPKNLALYENVPSNLTPEDFLNFHDYGLAIGEMKDIIDEEPGKLQFDANFEVTDMTHITVDEVSNSDLPLSENESDFPRNKSEIILMFFVDNIRSKTRESQEKDSVIRFQALKHHFSSILYKYSSKFGKACSSTLDKVLTNKTTEDQKKKIVSKAIDEMVKSFDSVLQITPNEDFKQQALSVMKVDDSSGFKAKVEENLWDLAQIAYSVQSPGGEVGASQLTEANNLIDDKITAKDVETHRDNAPCTNEPNELGSSFTGWHLLPPIDSIGNKIGDSFEMLGDIVMDDNDIIAKVQHSRLQENVCSFDSLGYLEFEDSNDGFPNANKKKTVINCNTTSLQEKRCNFESLGDIHFEEDNGDEDDFLSEDDFEDCDIWNDSSSQCNFEFLGGMNIDEEGDDFNCNLKFKTYESSGNVLKLPSKRSVQEHPEIMLSVKTEIKPIPLPICSKSETLNLDRNVKKVKMEDADEEEWAKDLTWDNPET